jgi:L-rhamnose mutarotase
MENNMTIALIDGDVVAYMAAFAAQRNIYYVDIFCNGDASEQHEFVSKEEAQNFVEYLEAKPEYKYHNFVISKEVVAESAKHAEICARQIMMKILGDTKATNYKLFLTSEDKSCFRYKIAKTKPYKGNRLKSECCNSTAKQKINCYVCSKCNKICDLLSTKPVHYNHIRNWLQWVWEGYMVVGDEADDYLGIEQTKKTLILDNGTVDTNASIICSIDKDLMMIPGWHYNIKTGETTFVNENDAMRFFWKQMLMGDTVDNIQGVPRIGKVKASKLIDNCESLQKCREVVIEEYKKYYKDNWKEVYNEMGNLLWIKRENNTYFEDLKLGEETGQLEFDFN